MDCSVSQKIQFESKLARDNSIAKEARELSKNGFQFFGNNDCCYKVDPASNIYKYRITFSLCIVPVLGFWMRVTVGTMWQLVYYQIERRLMKRRCL